MKKTIVVLEQWRKAGYLNRLVTDGYSIRLEYAHIIENEWYVENQHQSYWLKVFRHK